MRNLVSIIAIIAFFGTCTNFIPLSALASPFGLLLIPFFLKYENKFPKFLYWILAFFIISIISVICYDPVSLITYMFYRYDGNFIVSYSPLLLIPVVSKRIDIEKFILKFIYFETIVNLLAFIVVFIVINKFNFSAEYSFGGLFIARNAAGGFFSFCITIAFLIFYKEKNIKNFLLLAINTFFLIATYSRGSLLGIVFCILLYLLFERNMGTMGSVLIVVLLAFEVFLVSKTFDIYKKASSQYNGYGYVTDSFDADENTKSANISIRLLFNWPSGIDEFLHSPVVGAGFGSVNDRPYRFNSSTGLVNFNQQPVKTYDDAHAHNSYFHIAGEQGLFGLTVFISFLISLFLYFKKNVVIMNEYPLLRNIMLLYILNISFMSLTEHRLTSPSNVLPFTLLIVIFFADYNNKKLTNKEVEPQL